MAHRGLLLAALSGVGCAPAPAELWVFETGGPCWSVDLGDGLDEESTDELQSLYACLNRTGDFDALGELMAAMEVAGRTGVPHGLELAASVNDLLARGLDPSAAVGALAELLEHRDDLLTPLVELAIELLYGVRYETVHAGITLADPASLEAGLVVPALPLARDAATMLLDDDGRALVDVADALEGELLGDALCTALRIAEDPAAPSLLADVPAALDAVISPENDRWSEASGDSVRDLVEMLLLGDAPLLDTLAPPLAEIMADVTLGQRLEPVLYDAAATGALEGVPAQLRHLVTVDVNGRPLGAATEASALLTLLRLHSATNTELQCSLDLWVTDLEVDLGNLGVELLRTIAHMDPDDVNTGISILGTILGWDLSQATLEAIAESGVCPSLTPQVVEDMQVLDRLIDPEVEDLTAVAIPFLAAFDQAGTSADRIPELVDLLALAYDTGIAPPLEEILRDVGDSALVDDAIALVPYLVGLRQMPLATCPTGAEPLLFEDVWVLGGEALGEPAGALRPVLLMALESDTTWALLPTVSGLLADPDTRLRRLDELAAAALEIDPDLAALDSVAGTLRDTEALGPALRMLESEPLITAIGATEIDAEGPLPWLVRLEGDGTLAALMRFVELVFNEVGAPESTSG